ncbi:hypothetical protein ACQCVH_10800 [Bacillus infantis]|jgi:hypothetical protein|uniref:hypothetical protein n=1 Tax=Bacillus infantis TaxID=324767 RepID=UPI003CEE48AE
MGVRRFFVVIAAFIVLGMLASTAQASEKKTYHTATLALTDTERVLVKTSHSIDNLQITESEYPGSKDTVYTYDIKRFNLRVGELKIVKRQFENGDYFLFTKIRNMKDFDFYMELEYKFPKSIDIEMDAYSKYPKPTGTSVSMGEDITSYPTGLLKMTEEGRPFKQIMAGKSYRSLEQIKRYEHVNKSVIRDLKSETDAVEITEEGDAKHLVVSLNSMGRDITEQWLMVSNAELFKNTDELHDWMKYSAANYRKTNKWYTADGPYNKMVLTVEPQPRSKMGYGRTLLMFREHEALKRVKATGERYYQNLVYNSVADLLNFRGDRTFWETEVTSTYLKNLYNITAPFIDTRFNEYIALYLEEIGEDLNLPELQEPLVTYADFLLSQFETGNVIKVNERGALIPDYFAVFDPVLTHTSLNHGLGGMNILLEAYTITNDTKYLIGAYTVQEGINGLGMQWIRDDGDTWYKVNPDLTFIGRDYETLTVEDLLKSYDYWQKIDPSQLPMIETFLESKTSYLKRTGIHIPADLQDKLYSYGIGN